MEIIEKALRSESFHTPLSTGPCTLPSYLVHCEPLLRTWPSAHAGRYASLVPTAFCAEQFAHTVRSYTFWEEYPFELEPFFIVLFLFTGVDCRFSSPRCNSVRRFEGYHSARTTRRFVSENTIQQEFPVFSLLLRLESLPLGNSLFPLIMAFSP